MTRLLPSGVYAPLPTFFDNQDELDLKAYVKHALCTKILSLANMNRLNKKMIQGHTNAMKDVSKHGVIPVVSATMGEAAHLDRQERIQLIQALRSALDENDLRSTPVVAGVGATSTRETISLAKDAAAAGAEFVLLIAPGYFANALKASPTAIKDFFIDVAFKSPVPVVIYNYPAVAGGIDLISDDVVDIARAAPNVCGIMLSCGNVGKVSRITSLVDASFKTIAGFFDFLLPAVSVGSTGAISPLPNVAPEFAMELWRVTQSLDSAADWAKAKRLQEIASLAEAELLKGGVAGLKYLLNQRFGYSAVPRLPLQPLGGDAAVRLANSQYLKSLISEK